ncbi:unnamed protein product [Alopecurus aequalis]
MRLRVDKLKQDVSMLFKACKHVIETLTLVNALQLLGIGHLFEEEVDIRLRHIHDCEFNSSSLYEEALRFRLLREHGLWVSPDVFNKFKDERGSFRKEITNEPKGVLGLYNATFLLIHGEPELEEAMSFARYHLELMRDSFKSPLAEQVKRALHIPLPRTYRRLETMHYLSEYTQEEGHSPILLELAKLEFTLLQYVHLKELKSISRWDRNADSLLPEYLKMFYNLILTTFKDFEDRLGLDKRNQVMYVKKEVSSYLLPLTTWSIIYLTITLYTVECYMYDHKVDIEVALARIDSFMEDEWKTINQARFEGPGLILAKFLKRVINYATSSSLFYGRNKEGFTFGGQLREIVDTLFVKSVPL